MNDWMMDALVRQFGADSQHVKVWLYQKGMVSRFVRETVQLEDIIEAMVDLMKREKCAEALSMGERGLDELSAIRKSYYQGVGK